jgi:hypothetical protein
MGMSARTLARWNRAYGLLQHFDVPVRQEAIAKATRRNGSLNMTMLLDTAEWLMANSHHKDTGPETGGHAEQHDGH